MHDVAILIVTYNSADQIATCLQSVIDQRQRVSQQILVLDNASKDETVAILQRDFPDVELILPGQNLGFAAGVNEAARHANARFLLLLNPDTQILDHAIDRAVEYAISAKDEIMLGGRGVHPDGSLDLESCWGMPSLWSTAMFGTGLSTAFPRNAIFDPESMGSWKRDSIREVGFITGCFLLIHVSLWRKIAGFDERFFMYGEDVDLAMRARGVGAKVLVLPEATFLHEGGKSSATPVAKMILLFKGKSTFIRTHWHGYSRALGLFLLKAGVWMRGMIATFRAVCGFGDERSRWSELWQRRNEWAAGYGDLTLGLSSSSSEPSA